MELSIIRNGLTNIANEAGINLNPFEIAQIEAALHLLQSDNRFKKIYFWGAITIPLAKDHNHYYYIAFGHFDDSNQQQFFYSLNGIDWLLLLRDSEPLDEQNMHLTNVPYFQLTGDPSHLHESKPVDGNQREETLLAMLVHQISVEAAIIPRDAIYRRPNARTMPMACTPAQLKCIDLANYQYFMAAKSNSKIEKLSKVAIAVDKHNECIYLKSLLWPGMIAFHNAQSVYGFAYFGDGMKNYDVQFMCACQNASIGFIINDC